MKFKAGDIVWINLGISYGHWPGEFQEFVKSKEEIQTQTGKADKK